MGEYRQQLADMCAAPPQAPRPRPRSPSQQATYFRVNPRLIPSYAWAGRCRWSVGKWRVGPRPTRCGPHSSSVASEQTSGANTSALTLTTYVPRFFPDDAVVSVDPCSPSSYRHQEVAPRPFNELWVRFPAVSVFEEFMQGRGGAASADHGNFNDETRNDLLTFAKQMEERGGWKIAYKRFSSISGVCVCVCVCGVCVCVCVYRVFLHLSGT
jgi:hypothetical protein